MYTYKSYMYLHVLHILKTHKAKQSNVTYCTSSIDKILLLIIIVGYDSAVHKKIADSYQLIGSKLLEQLQNVPRKSVVFLAATSDTAVDDQSAKKLTEPLKKKIKNENVHHVCMSQEGMTQAKRTIEVIGIQAPFHDSKKYRISVTATNN